MSTQRSTASKPERPNGDRKQRHRRNAAAIALLERWLADTSGYDEETWDSLKTALEANRGSTRALFRD